LTVTPNLSLCEDVFSNDADVLLPAAPRMVFVVHGAIFIDGDSLGNGETWHGEGEVVVKAGDSGATIWRWDLATSAPASFASNNLRSLVKLSAPLLTLPEGALLMRGDSVTFPPGGCALTHVHQGPGIRCLIEGGIRIDTHGRSTSYGPGGAWFESGPDEVFAQAAPDRPSRFIRVMILPRALLGKSSIRYVNEADKGRSHSQTYGRFVDAPIAFGSAG
jgi:hypothetical protein